MVVIVLMLLSGQDLMAKVADPLPVSDGERTFRSHGNYVECIDSSSETVVWHAVLYKRVKPLIHNPFLEKDVQWNIISSLELGEDVLTVANMHGSMYFLDPSTGVQARTPIIKRDWWDPISFTGLCIVTIAIILFLIIRKKGKIS